MPDLLRPGLGVDPIPRKTAYRVAGELTEGREGGSPIVIDWRGSAIDIR